MNDVIKLLDKCKEIRSCASDNAFALEIGVTRQMVSNWRAGKNYPDAVNCAKLADIAGIPLSRVLGIVGEARAISADEKKVWRKLAQVAVLIICTLPIASIYAGEMGVFSLNLVGLYIMSKTGLTLFGSRYRFSNHERTLQA